MDMRIKKRTSAQRDWTKTKLYTSLALLATLLTASAAVISALRAHEKIPTPSPPIQPPIVNSPAVDVSKQRICAEWTSSRPFGSGKRYSFVCGAQGSVEIFLVDTKGLTRVGEGTITSAGTVAATLTIARTRTQPRKAYLELTPSPDGQSLQGPWHGDDPREKGELVLKRS